MNDDNGKPFTDTLYNVILEPVLRDQSFSIISLYIWDISSFFINYLYSLFSDNKQNAVELPHIAQMKYTF